MSERVAEGSTSGRPGSTSFFATPFAIGDLEVANRLILAPMAGLTISAYRTHLKTHGVGLVTTEMVSAHGLLHGNMRTWEYLKSTQEERPLAVQLFGDTPEALAGAAEAMLSRGPVADLIDINMGCPVRKVLRTGAGAALLGDPDRAVAVAAAVVRVASQGGIPVTVKLRSGLKAGEQTAVALGRRLEEVGVQALTVHPRAAEQHYRGPADHTLTAAVVQKVGIPVVASGDIRSVSDALAVHERTGVEAVMLARGVAGNPWLADALLEGWSAPRPPLNLVVDDLRALIGRAMEERGPDRAIRWARQLLGWYLRPSGVPAGVVAALRMLTDVVSLDEALTALVDSRAQTPRQAE